MQHFLEQVYNEKRLHSALGYAFEKEPMADLKFEISEANINTARQGRNQRKRKRRRRGAEATEEAQRKKL